VDSQVLTVAAHAENELTDRLYSDSGIYRARQFGKAETITLRTTQDEAYLLWDTELKYRPGFMAENGEADIPVLYARFSGVEDGKTLKYWQRIRQLRDTGDTLFIDALPYINPGEANRFHALAQKGIKNGALQRDAITGDRLYPFGLLRSEMQAHILDKLSQLLEQRLIKGTFETGVEYTVLSTVLNMKKELLRLIQGFDFTGRNPKLLIVHTRDCAPSLEDAILTTFLNKLGFDIALFVPTGYQTVEKYLNGDFPVEDQLGEYVYDLAVPDLDSLPPVKGHSWLSGIFRRG
jgi:hypothetical protein